MSLISTTSQTVGPFFSIGLSHLCAQCTYDEGAAGSVIHISGRVTDGQGLPVPDAQLEFWQADAQGRYPHTEGADAKFFGFVRLAADAQGYFSLRTILPGRTVGGDGTEDAPHIVVLVFLRGILRHLVTRIYFEAEPLNTSDLVLRSVPEERRETLLARKISPDAYQWDLRLQGEQETVFFAY